MTRRKPNYTQVSNVILDNLDQLGHAELKCILVIVRKTAGWHKPSDRLSITTLMLLTGLSKRAVISACSSLTKRGWINRIQISHPKGFAYLYELKLKPEEEQQQCKTFTGDKSSCHEISSPHEGEINTPLEDNKGEINIPLEGNKGEINTPLEDNKGEISTPHKGEISTPSKEIYLKEKNIKKKNIKKGVSANATPDACDSDSSKKKKKQKTAEEIYANLTNPEAFERWWNWYKSKCKQYRGNFGDKAAAAEQWTIMHSKPGFEYERFKEGCQAWVKQLEANPVGLVVHGYIFLKGKETHLSPYWESALEKIDSSAAKEFICEKSESLNSEATERILEQRRKTIDATPEEMKAAMQRARKQVDEAVRGLVK